MKITTHYNRRGEIRGKSVTESAQEFRQRHLNNLIGLVAIVVIFFAYHFLKVLLATIAAPGTLQAPYNYFAYFYHYAAVVPFKWGISYWNWMTTTGITKYPNLNLVIALATCAIAVMLIAAAIMKANKSTNGVVTLIVITPGLLWALYAVGDSTISWLLR